jgi:hypothetical protein
MKWVGFNRDVALETDVLICRALALIIGSGLVQEPFHPFVQPVAVLLDQHELFEKDDSRLFTIGISSRFGRKDISALQSISF